jgi:DNA polymerase/3'-5' exonuclease PolX
MLLSVLARNYPYYFFLYPNLLSHCKKVTPTPTPTLTITSPEEQTTTSELKRETIFEPEPVVSPTMSATDPILMKRDSLTLQSSGVDLRTAIATELDVLRRTSSTESAGIFKARSYEAAIKYIHELPGPITCLADLPPHKKGDALTGKIREKVAEYITTGRIADVEEARQSRNPDTIEAFMNVYGIGPKKAMDLIKAGHRSIADLRVAAAADPKLLNKNQRIGLLYYDDLLLRIPRTEMDAHATTLMTAKPPALEGVIVGSYRRGRPDSGDIDMLIRTTDAATNVGKSLADYVKHLKSTGYIKEVLAIGDHKCLAISQLPGAPARRLDLLVTPPEEFPFAVLYFTGSDGFNVRMRQMALGHGFTLNEHALTHVKTGKTVTNIKSEADIFTALKMEWREPVDRTGPEAAVSIA